MLNGWEETSAERTEIRDCQFLMRSGLSQLIFVSVGQIKARKKRESNCEPFISNHRDNLVKELVIVRLVNATPGRNPVRGESITSEAGRCESSNNRIVHVRHYLKSIMMRGDWNALREDQNSILDYTVVKVLVLQWRDCGEFLMDF